MNKILTGVCVLLSFIPLGLVNAMPPKVSTDHSASYEYARIAVAQANSWQVLQRIASFNDSVQLTSASSELVAAPRLFSPATDAREWTVLTEGAARMREHCNSKELLKTKL
jgi:hypothetical protein